MKTLDEVITIMDGIDQTCTCCAYQHDCDETECVEKTALHYLREYRKNQEDPDGDHQQLQKCQTLLQDFYRNDPLIWDELRRMTGKPVWLESHGGIEEFTGWVIVNSVLSDRAHFIFSHYDGNFLAYEMALPDCTFGKKWNVYRKERR